jgi:hypothetical protein
MNLILYFTNYRHNRSKGRAALAKRIQNALFEASTQVALIETDKSKNLFNKGA